MASSVKEKDITKLRAAGYLAKENAHRLPTKGDTVSASSATPSWFWSIDDKPG